MANVVYKLSAKEDKVTGKREIHVRFYAGRGLDYRAKTREGRPWTVRVPISPTAQEIKDPNLIAKISGHVENFRAFNRYRNIDEEMAKETIMKLE